MTICVQPEYRESGVGADLLTVWFTFLSLKQQKICLLLNQQGCNTVYLHVLTTNQKAIKFYKNRGFRTVKFHDGFYRINSTYQDAYEMALSLPKLLTHEEELQELMIPTHSELQIELIAKDKSTGSLITALFMALAVVLLIPMVLFYIKKV